MKANQTKELDVAAAQAIRKADQETVPSAKQREDSPNGTAKAERATTQ